MNTVVFITNNFPPINCGVGDYTYNLAKEFIKNGHNVSIICNNSAEIKNHWKSNDEGFNVYPLAKNWGFGDVTLALQLIKKIEPNYLLIQYVPYSYSKLGVPFSILRLYCASTTYKILTTFHEFGKIQSLKKIKYLPIGLFQFLIGFYIAFRSNKIVVSTNAVKKFMPISKTIKLPVGSNFKIITGSYNKSTTHFKICTAGLSLTRNQLLCDAVTELIKNQIKVELVILGKVNTSIKERLEFNLPDLHKSSIKFTGLLEAEEFGKHLNSADLFCLIEYVDKNGVGGVGCKSGILAAAFGYGLPVVITKGSITDVEILKHGENVWAVNYEKKAIVNAIEFLISQAEIRKKIGVGAKSTYEELMSWPQLYTKYKNHLHNA